MYIWWRVAKSNQGRIEREIWVVTTFTNRLRWLRSLCTSIWKYNLKFLILFLIVTKTSPHSCPYNTKKMFIRIWCTDTFIYTSWNMHTTPLYLCSCCLLHNNTKSSVASHAIQRVELFVRSVFDNSASFNMINPKYDDDENIIFDITIKLLYTIYTIIN